MSLTVILARDHLTWKHPNIILSGQSNLLINGLDGKQRRFMNPAPQCLRCSTAMQEGFIWDSNFSMDFVTRWVPGAPKPGFFGPKVPSKDVCKVLTFRCPKCGYLESYAPG